MMVAYSGGPGDKAGADAARRKAKQADKDAKMTPKQIRARARRARIRAERRGVEPPKVSAIETAALMRKPLGDWDLEELARGYPKDKNGNFSGSKPKWIDAAMHEQIVDQFKELVRTDMKSLTVKALDVLEDVLENDEVDERGRPVTPVNTKVDVAKFLLEHLIGKPTQPIQNDISIKLQGILGAVLVQPAEAGGYVPSSSHRVLEDIVDADLVDEEDE